MGAELEVSMDLLVPWKWGSSGSSGEGTITRHAARHEERHATRHGSHSLVVCSGRVIEPRNTLNQHTGLREGGMAASDGFRSQWGTLRFNSVQLVYEPP